MKNAALFSRSHQLPLRHWLWIDIRLPRDHDPIDAKLCEQSFRSRLRPKQIFRHVRIELAMDREVEFTRDAGRSNWAVAVKETQPSPPRSATRPNSLTDRAGFFLHAISTFRRRINAQVKPLRIERRGLEQSLIEIVLRHAAIGRNKKIGRKQRSEGHTTRRPSAQRFVAQKEFGESPNAGDRQQNPNERKSVKAANAQHRHSDGDQADKEKRGEAADLSILREIVVQSFGGAERENEMKEWQPAKAPAEHAHGRQHREQQHQQEQDQLPFNSPNEFAAAANQ